MFRSLVTPEKFETIADLDDVSLLKIEDLPTFGLPIIATEEIIFRLHIILSLSTEDLYQEHISFHLF